MGDMPRKQLFALRCRPASSSASAPRFCDGGPTSQRGHRFIHHHGSQRRPLARNARRMRSTSVHERSTGRGQSGRGSSRGNQALLGQGWAWHAAR